MWTVIEDKDFHEVDPPWWVLDEDGEMVVVVEDEKLARQIALLPDLIENVKGCGTSSARKLREKLAEIEEPTLTDAAKG